MSIAKIAKTAKDRRNCRSHVLYTLTITNVGNPGNLCRVGIPPLLPLRDIRVGTSKEEGAR